MTEPTPTMGEPTESAFDAFVHPASSNTDSADSETAEAQSPQRGWRLLIATALLTMLGAGAIIAAMLAPLSTSAAPVPSSSPTPASTSPHPIRTPIPTTASPGAGTTGARPSTRVAELADPEWVSRIAVEGNIPERALGAYAGAALATASTHPGCGLGWNTLAAIGHVESEHGTIAGSRIGTDGVASPTIIGIPLSGDGTAVHDTDLGELDGDTAWDRAVGPMQFIPETWTRYAQDGNGDGETDVNQIDDAALAAAVYLCTAGGDLTDAASWIAAINAYNPSVEYNNRVAESANHYATLR